MWIGRNSAGSGVQLLTLDQVPLTLAHTIKSLVVTLDVSLSMETWVLHVVRQLAAYLSHPNLAMVMKWSPQDWTSETCSM